MPSTNLEKRYSVGRGDSSHHTTRAGDSSHSPFWGEKTWKSKNHYYHYKGQVIISKWPRFQPNSTDVSIFPKFPQKKSIFLTLVKFGWSQSPVFVQFIITLLLIFWSEFCCVPCYNLPLRCPKRTFSYCCCFCCCCWCEESACIFS